MYQSVHDLLSLQPGLPDWFNWWLDPWIKSYMEETGEGYYDVDFDLNDDEYMEEVMGRFRAANAGLGWIIFNFIFKVQVIYDP